MQWCSWLRHCTTDRKVMGSIPNGVTGIFHWHNPYGCKVALVVHMRFASNWKTVWRDWLHLQRANFQEITNDQNSSGCSLNSFHLQSLQNSFTCFCRNILDSAYSLPASSNSCPWCKNAALPKCGFNIMVWPHIFTRCDSLLRCSVQWDMDG